MAAEQGAIISYVRFILITEGLEEGRKQWVNVP